MAFMRPYYTDEDFHTGNTRHGEYECAPASVWGTRERFASETGCKPPTVETVTGKWWGRLSASGYMDCTEWDGPHDTLDEAKESLMRTFDVDPETGEDTSEITEANEIATCGDS